MRRGILFGCVESRQRSWGTRLWNDVNEKAWSLAQVNPKLMEGTETEKAELKKLLGPDSELSWDELIEKYPRAYEKFEKFWDAAESTLDKDLIQARIVMQNLDTIERIEQFIAIAQRRLDTVIREFDRHRFVQDQRASIQNVVDAEFKSIKQTAPPPKITKVA
jgi:hypothetical protein